MKIDQNIVKMKWIKNYRFKTEKEFLEEYGED